ncbi:TonB-dependent receptor SusC, partial [termite gut metagenome]
MKKRLKLLLICLFMGSGLLVAQTQRVTGIVISEEDDQPVIGASILIKGTGIGTVTDANGRFILPNAPNSAILQVSFIGMATQEVAARPNVRVVLKPDAQQLDEVEIVVAYGVAKKSSLTGAVSSIDAATIEKRPVSSASGILEGAAPGIQVNNTYGEPGADATIRIRGFGSVNGSNNPLYVLDGVAFGGNISDINPNDIESITVLKDAASAALYGNRASNGVILITTKKGKSNRTSVRVNANQGVYNRGIAEYDRMGPDDFMETMWIGYRNSLLTKSPASYPTTESANAKASETLISDYLKTNIYNQKNNALFDSNGKLVAGAQVLDGYKDDLDWYKGLERLGHRQEYNLNGDAASEQGNYYFSVGYLDEKGYVISSDFQRFTGRANINLTPKQWLRTGLSLSGSHQTTNNTNGTSTASYVNPFMYARQIAPIYPVHLHDPETGNYVLDENGNKQYDNGEGGRNQYIGRHVIWENELDMDRTYRNTLIGQAYVDIIFLKDFTFTTKGDLNVRNSENQTYNSAIIGDGYGNHGRAKRVIYRYKNYTMQEQLTWRKKINSLHTFDA